MTNDRHRIRPTAATPFLLRYGERIPSSPVPKVVYDCQQQLVQILIGGAWEEAADCDNDSLWRATLVTCISRETTDDE